MKPSTAADLISLREAAELLGKSKVTVWRWVKSGRLAAVEIADRQFVSRQDVLREHRRTSRRAAP